MEKVAPEQLSIFDNGLGSFTERKSEVEPCDLCIHAHKRHCETCTFSCLDCRMREYICRKLQEE